MRCAHKRRETFRVLFNYSIMYISYKSIKSGDVKRYCLQGMCTMQCNNIRFKIKQKQLETNGAYWFVSVFGDKWSSENETKSTKHFLLVG